MEKNFRRNRVALLGALFVTGLVLAGLGTAFGAGAVFQEETPLRLKAISEGDSTKIVVFKDGEEAIETLNVSKVGAFSIVSSASSGEIRIESEPRLAMVGAYTAGDMYTKLSEEQRCKAIEIAKRNETVQKVLEGAENYHITVYDVMKMEEIEKEGKGRGIKLVHEEDKARVEIRVFKEYEEEKGFKECSVIVDLAKEEVTEINEVPEIRKAKIPWENNLNEMEVVKEEAVKIALNDSRVQELIEGKEYQVFGVGTVDGIGSADWVALGLGIEEKVYTIWVDMKNQTVTSIEEQSGDIGDIMHICVGQGCENVNLTDFTVGEIPAMGMARAVQVNLSELRLEIITCEKNLTEEEKARAKKIALSDSRVQERIEGKEYEIKAINAHMLSQITGECELLGASVFIDLPEIDKWFNVNVDLEEGKVRHISPLIPIPKPPEEQ
ncbi:MAG: hypothetical protein U9N41_05515 [Euryarchaeota archaeon]|nr:hypothetical protein [Euryarchaeota archaeon]